MTIRIARFLPGIAGLLLVMGSAVAADTGDVKNGTFDGTTVDFAITAHVSNAEAGDWVFHGTLVSGQLTGTVSTALGTQPFTGRKTP